VQAQWVLNFNSRRFDMSACSFWKTKAALRRALMLVSMGLGAALLPALGSAQTQQQLQTWQENIKSTINDPSLSVGCFQASYPST
jgi:hypothetical protein